MTQSIKDLPEILDRVTNDYVAYGCVGAFDSEFSIAADLKALRARLQMSQEKFSEVYNIPVKNIRNWEQGDRNNIVPDSAARLLLKMINVNPKLAAQLIFDADNVNPNKTAVGE